MNNYSWSFPSNSYGQRQGISESGVETFQGRPIKSLAREICQNSLDAGIEGEKVIIEFKKFEVDKNDFPGIERFQRVLDLSEYTWKNQKTNKTRDFITSAKSVISGDKIPFIRVSDFNTKGLTGSDKAADSNWNNLVKASGSSDKSDISGGSFGIGKYAPFACSDLRTVFYSTIDENGLEATQGISRLVSFKLKEDTDEETQGTGYYGIEEKHKPIHKYYSLDKNFERSVSGTDIFIAGFKDFEEWELDLINEVLDGFLYAILKNTLEVRIENIIINKDTINDVIKKYDESIDKKTKQYYEVFTSTKTHWKEEDFNNWGNVKLGLLITENESSIRKVAMIRNPWMKIKDQANISGSIPFVGVCIIKGEGLNKFLRSIENPQHTEWETNRAGSKSKINASKNLISRLRKFIIDEINELAQNNDTDSIDIEGAGDFIPLDESGDNDESNEKDVLSPRVRDINIKTKDKVPSKASKKDGVSNEERLEMSEGSYVDGDYETRGNHGGGENSLDNPGNIPSDVEEGNNKVYKNITVKPLDLRFISINKDVNKYRIIFKVGENIKNVEIGVFQLDDVSSKSIVTIKSAHISDKPLKTESNKIFLNEINSGTSYSIDFETIEDYYFSAEVTINGNQ